MGRVSNTRPFFILLLDENLQGFGLTVLPRAGIFPPRSLCGERPQAPDGAIRVPGRGFLMRDGNVKGRFIARIAGPVHFVGVLDVTASFSTESVFIFIGR